MKLSVFLHAFSYVVTLCGGIVIQKIFNYYYGYNDFMFTTIQYSVFAPLNLLTYLYFGWHVKLDPKVWPKFFLPAMIYTAETLLLAFVLNNIELGLYIIARTSYSIFNWFSYRYIVKRTLNRYYYIGVTLLILSYVFVMLDFSSTGSTLGMIMFCVCLATGGSTSVYNTLAEQQLSGIKEHKMIYTLFNNCVFQMVAFTINMPIAFPLVQKEPILEQIVKPDFVILAIVSALGFQLYSVHKFFILNDPDINGSMIISSLDLVRRIIVNVISYTALKEPVTAFNMTSNGLLLVASLALFYSSNAPMPLDKDTPDTSAGDEEAPNSTADGDHIQLTMRKKKRKKRVRKGSGDGDSVVSDGSYASDVSGVSGASGVSGVSNASKASKASKASAISTASKASTVRAVTAASDVVMSASVSRDAAYELAKEEDEEEDEDGLRFVPEPTGESESDGEEYEDEEDDADEEKQGDGNKPNNKWNWFKPGVNRQRSMHFQAV